MKAMILAIFGLVIFAGCNRSKEPTTTSGSATVLVTESHLRLLTEEATEFMRTYADAKLQMSGTTTREAIVALLNDSVHCICVDRELNAEERKVVKDAGKQIAVIRFGRNALAVIVNNRVPLKTMTLKTLVGIIEGSVTDWRQIPGAFTTGRMDLALTGRNSGTYELLQRGFFHLAKDLATTHSVATEYEVADYVSLNSKALGVVSLAALLENPRGIHILALDSPDSTMQGQFVQPSQSNIFEMLYPLSYSLYLYVSENRLGVGSGFSTFVRSMPGQKIIQNFGLVPEKLPERIIQLNSE